MAKPRFVHTYRSRGRAYYYFRRAGVNERLSGDPSTPAFWTRYSELLAETAPTMAPIIGAAQPGTVGALVAAFRSSAEWKAYSENTRTGYLQTFARLEAILGARAVAIERRHVLRLRDKTAETTTSMADALVAHMRVLFRFGIQREFGAPGARLKINPAIDIDPIHEGESHRRWTAEDHARFEACDHPEGHLTAYMLGTYTGQRKGDCLTLRAEDIRDGWVILERQQKTGRRIEIPVHKDLSRYLRKLRRPSGILALNKHGRPFASNGFSASFGVRVKAAGLEGLTFHGLRHSAGSRLAEAGCSEIEIQTILGHATPDMARVYTQGARRRTMAQAAMRKLEGKR